MPHPPLDPSRPSSANRFSFPRPNPTQPNTTQPNPTQPLSTPPHPTPPHPTRSGGPGCSGLLGALTELGPYRPTADGKALEDNPYTWNQNVNFVFIEQPCGVGFSYGDSDDDLKSSDEQAANDNYAMLQAFFVRFPQFSKNKLYLTSESYGGHYLPTLAKVIVDQNAAGVYPKLNFGGFAVGNPATTSESTTPAMIQTWWGHQLLSKPDYDNFQKMCVESKIPHPQDCEMLFLDFYQKTSSVNPYALDYPVCLSDTHPLGGKYGRSQRLFLLRNQLQHLSPKVKEALKLDAVMGDEYQACEDDWMTTYLNRADVKAALHVKSDITWSDCSRTIKYDQRDGAKSMVPTYQYLLDGNYDIDILVYSGDDDSVCGTVGTQDWIWGVGGEAKSGSNWAKWNVPKDSGNGEAGQLGGYLTRFKGKRLAFATVHGAGHEVPTYKPAAAKELFTQFMSGAWTKNN